MSDPLDSIGSAAIRWAAVAAIAEGCALDEIADWSRARVAHMSEPMPPGLRERVQAAWPGLVHYAEPATPHMPAHEGFADAGCAIAFPVKG